MIRTMNAKLFKRKKMMTKELNLSRKIAQNLFNQAKSNY